MAEVWPCSWGCWETCGIRFDLPCGLVLWSNVDLSTYNQILNSQKLGHRISARPLIDTYSSRSTRRIYEAIIAIRSLAALTIGSPDKPKSPQTSPALGQRSGPHQVFSEPRVPQLQELRLFFGLYHYIICLDQILLPGQDNGFATFVGDSRLSVKKAHSKQQRFLCKLKPRSSAYLKVGPPSTAL